MENDIHDPNTYIDPKTEDILLSDVKEADLKESVAEALRVVFLSTPPPTETLTWPVKGILFGLNMKPFASLVVGTRSGKVKFNVFFLIDTGSPNTHISATTMEALGYKDTIPQIITGKIQGVPMASISLSPLSSHYADLNVLGANFFGAARGKLSINYASLDVLLEKE